MGARQAWLLAILVLSGLAPRAMASVPAAPSNCSAVAVSATATNATVEIGWTDNSTDETQWKIQYTTNNWASSSTLTLTAATPATTTGALNYQWTGAALNTSYRFRVVAANAAGSSAASNDCAVGTFDLAAPTNFTATVVDPFNVSLKWEDNSTAEAGTAIEMKAGNGAWSYLGYLNPNSVSVDPVLLIYPSQSFTFRARTFKGGAPQTPDSAAGATAVSAYSAPVTVTTGAYALTATAIPGTTSVTLSWPNILNENGYQILYKAAEDSSFAAHAWPGADVTSYQIDLPATAASKNYSFIVEPYANNNVLGDSTTATVKVASVISSQSGTSGTPGSPFSHQFAYISDDPVSSMTLTGIPDGLTFDNTTGLLSGVYPALGNYTLTYTVTFTTGEMVSQTFYIRVRRSAGPPVVTSAIPVWSGVIGETHDTPLAGTFIAPEADSAVRVSTTLGDMDIILYDGSTPATVANFMTYVNEGKYTDVDFHRSIPGFVIQAGGFKGAGSGNHFTSVVTDPPVVNEPGIANVRGTVSMAKVGGNPNSATSQFFVSLADNRANLDYQNGGFTVFGRVAGNGMTVADAISNLPNGTYQLLLDGGATATQFDNFPMNDTSFPATVDQTKLVKMNSVTAEPTLSYAITGNTQPTVASASIVNGQLHLVGLAAGQTTISVTATDLDNLSTTQTVDVTIANINLATVTLGNLAATYDGTPKAVTATTTPDGLQVDISYNGSATPPSAVGSYPVTATVNAAGYQGSASGTLVISKAVATVTLGNLAANWDGTAKAATATTTPGGLAVGITYNGSATPPTNAGSYAVVATVNDPIYQGSATGTLVITGVAAKVTLAGLTTVYNKLAKPVTASTSPSGLTVVITYNGSSTPPVNAGSYAVVATISNAKYQGSATGTLTIAKAAASVTLGGLSQTYTGQARVVTAISSPTGLAINLTYNGSATAPVGAGSYPVVATIVDANYAGSKSGTLVVAKAKQTITFSGAPLTAHYGDADYPLTATASSGLPVGFVSSTPALATIVGGNQLHIVGAGKVTVTATQPGDANWTAASSVAKAIVISKESQTITFAALAGHTVGDADFSPGATASSGLAASYASSSSSVATIVAGQVHLVGKGTTVITASQAGNLNWAAAVPVTQTLVVAGKPQSITFPAIPDKGYGTADFVPGATASSALAVTYLSSNPLVATISSGKIHITGVGSTVITARQAGSSIWAAADDVTLTWNVVKGTPVITWANPAAITTATALTTSQLNAKASVAGAFVYSPAAGVKLPAGLQTLNVTFTPTDTTRYEIVQKSVSVQVN